MKNILLGILAYTLHAGVAMGATEKIGPDLDCTSHPSSGAHKYVQTGIDSSNGDKLIIIKPLDRDGAKSKFYKITSSEMQAYDASIEVMADLLSDTKSSSEHLSVVMDKSLTSGRVHEYQVTNGKMKLVDSYILRCFKK